MSENTLLDCVKASIGEAPPKLTESDLFAMLRKKLTRPGNGGAGEYAVLRGVRNAAGFDATRTFDAIAVSLWPSRGFTIHCYEIKCSRSDWLRELKEPAKAEAAAKFCDRFSVVAADSSIVAEGELPPTWGLLVAGAKGLQTVVAAPLLPGADTTRAVPRSFLVPLLRSAGATAATPAEVNEARSQGHAEGVASAERAWKYKVEQHDELAGRVRAFEDAAGVKLGHRFAPDPAVLGAAVRAVLESGNAEKRARTQLEGARRTLASTLEAIDAALGTEPK